MINHHDNIQNIVWFDFPESGYKLIIANADIKKGEEILYDYISII